MHCRAALATVALMAISAAAVPTFWLQNDGSLQEGYSDLPSCARQPTGAYGRHGAPVKSSDIVFSVKQKGRQVNHVCPGGTYDVQVKLTEPSYGILSTTRGSLSASGESCPARMVIGRDDNSDVIGKRATWSTKLTLPCDATGTAKLYVTAASHATDHFHQNSLALKIHSACNVPAACSDDPNAAVTTAPPPSRSNATKVVDQEPDLEGTQALRDPGLVDAFSRGMCLTPARRAPACTPSPLGYACSLNVTPTFTLHWTVGGCPPDNPCTRSSALRNPAADPTAGPYLHMAATARTRGYVAVAFAKRADAMPFSDAVVGWVTKEGSVAVDAYYIRTHVVLTEDMYAGDKQWMVLGGAHENEAALTTTVCFSRPMDAPSAKVSGKLPLDRAVAMHWAVGRNQDDTLRHHADEGGFVLNLDNSYSEGVGRRQWWLVHGVLMALAWVGLLPMSVLSARHRWLFGDREVIGRKAWFLAHVGLMALGVALFFISSVIALATMTSSPGVLPKAHKWLGVTIMILAGCQVLSGFGRPNPSLAMRKGWNYLHWNIGRLLLLASIIQCFLGVWARERTAGGPLTGWYAALGVMAGVWGVADAVLLVSKWRENYWVVDQEDGEGDKGTAMKLYLDKGGVGPATPVSLPGQENSV